MNGRFVGKRGHMQPSQADECILASIMVCDFVGAVGVGDVNLDHDEVGLITETQLLDMFVHNHRMVIGRQICGERGKAQGRKE
jgi:hypothetical protein